MIQRLELHIRSGMGGFCKNLCFAITHVDGFDPQMRTAHTHFTPKAIPGTRRREFKFRCVGRFWEVDGRSDCVRNARSRPILPDEDCSGPPASRRHGVALISPVEISSQDDCSLRTVDNGRPVRASANFGRGTGPRRD